MKPIEFMTDERITAYLLDELPQHEAEQFEEECFAQPEWPEVELESAEEDLIQAYIKNELSPERRRRFEENYLTTTAREDKVLFARSFLRVVCPAGQPTWTQRLFGFLKSLVFAPQFAVPRLATIFVTLGLIAALLWWFVYPPKRPQTFAHINLTLSFDRRAASNRVENITLPLAEDALRISMALPEPAPEGATYRVQWENVKGPLEELKIERQDTKSVSVIIPANKLIRGQYLLKLFRKDPDGTETPVPGSYLFNASSPVLGANVEITP